jgi:photosystem II stability/assembly factor-like uncharacterized protein
MKGDFTRFTHDPKKHYTGVLKQQGRVDLDADDNEQAEIQDHLRRTANRDIIGLCGAPRDGGGFEIEVLPADLLGVCFVDDDNGWVVGSRSTILFTENGGKSWTAQKSGVYADLCGVFFVDIAHGWTVGSGGTILATTDGGNTWKQQKSGVTADLHGVYFVDKNHGWTVGNGATVLATADGGVTWNPQTDGVSGDLNAVHFKDENYGWIAGYNKNTILGEGTILFTDDGGKTWNTQKTLAKFALYGVCLVDEAHGWAVGGSGTILATIDGGTNWKSQTSKTNEQLHAVHFVDEKTGWAVGSSGTILATSDGGNDWKSQASEISDHLLGVHRGWAVGMKGAILAPPATGTASRTAKELPDYLAFPPAIHKGRIYVNGILADLGQKTTYCNQTDYPRPQPLEGFRLGVQPRTDLIYLDVWQRHITAIEDTDIREVALGGADTTTRIKTICQVKVLGSVGNVKCEDSIANVWPPVPALVDRGRLSTQAVPVISEKDPCHISPGGGYRGLENRLYRVEIHEGGNIQKGGKPTFKWSRDNGSIAFPIDSLDGSKLKVKHLGKDQVLTLQEHGWAEISGDETELNGEPGTLVQIYKIEDMIEDIIVTLSSDVSSYSLEGHPKIRRWDDSKALSMAEGGISIEEDKWIELENGVQIKFEKNRSYYSGDYWVFAARISTGKVEALEKSPPRGIEHHYCRLALVKWEKKAQGPSFKVEDCRKLFPALTEMMILSYVGGDGQEAEPGDPLGEPLRVRVTNGKWPIKETRIKFKLVKGGGSLKEISKADWAETYPDGLAVYTNDKGIAECNWTLGANGPQSVKATFDQAPDDILGLPIYFTASFSQPAVGKKAGCCFTVGTDGDYDDLNQVRNNLIGNRRNLCICLLEDDPEIISGILDGKNTELHIIGWGNTINSEGLEVKNFSAFGMKGLKFRGPLKINGGHVSMRSCTIEDGIFVINAAGRILLEDCEIASSLFIISDIMGDATIKDNRISGNLVLGGEQVVDDPSRIGDFDFPESGPVLWLRGNRLSNKMSASSEILSLNARPFAQIFLIENIFEKAENGWIGKDLRFTNNHFNEGDIVGNAFNDTAIYIGNSSLPEGCLLVNKSQKKLEIGFNLNMNIKKS